MNNPKHNCIKLIEMDINLITAAAVVLLPFFAFIIGHCFVVNRR